MKRGEEGTRCLLEGRRDQPLRGLSPGARPGALPARRWDAAIESAKNAIRLNPWNHEARLLLVRCLLGAGRLPEARGRVPGLLDQDPPGRDELKAWFDGSTSRSIEK